MTEALAANIRNYVIRLTDGWLTTNYHPGRGVISVHAPRLGIAVALGIDLRWEPMYPMMTIGYPHNPRSFSAQYPYSCGAPMPLPKCDNWRDAVWYALRPERLPSAEPGKKYAVTAVGKFDPLIIAVILAHIGRN